MPGIYYHAVWLWTGSGWHLAQATGPQTMDYAGAVRLSASDPYTGVPPLPFAWGGLWELAGGSWRLVESRSNY